MPSPTYQEIPLTFEKGLVLETEESVLGEGMAAALYNWTPEHTGGLRARNRWRAISETGFTDTTFNCRGWGSIGVSSAPAVVQSTSNNDNTTTKPMTLLGVGAGSVVIVVLFGAETADALATGLTGFTEQLNAGSAIRIFTKTSSGGTESVTPAFTGTSTTRYAFMLEVVNISPTLDASGTDSGANSTFTATVVPTTDSSFIILGRGRCTGVASGTNSRPSMDTVLVESNESSGSTPYSLGYLYSGTSGSRDYTWTNTDPSTGMQVAAAAFKATNRSSRSFYVVMANAVTDAKLAGVLSGTSYIASETVTAVDATTVGTTSASPVTSGDVLFCVVGNRKGTTPDTPTVTGTNAYSGTWTQVTTVLTGGGSRRLTVFRSTAQSTTAGVVTAAFGGATQLTMAIHVIEMSATEVDATTPTVQAVTGSGTGTSMTATLAAFSDSVNVPAIFVLTAATAANALAPTLDLVEVREGGVAGSSEGMQIGSYVGYDSDNLTPTVTGAASLEWAAIAVEIDSLRSGVGYRIWQIPKDELDAGTWTELDSIADMTDTSALVSFAQGAGQLLWTASTMTYPRKITLSSGLAANITSISAGRVVCYHKNRFFMTGTTADPARVRFSDLADGATWGVNSYFDLNADDGEAAEDMVSVEGLLLVAKTNQTFLISGSGIESFFVNSLSGGSSATGRSLAKTPYGTILSGTYEMWSVQGGGIDPLSRPLGNGYTISGYVSSAYASDKAYVLDSGTGTIYAQDLITGAFALENVTHATDTPHVMFSVGRTLLYGTDNSTTYLGGYRSLADTRVGDATATTTEYDASTPLTFLLGPQVKYTPRHLFLQVRRQGASPANLTVTVETPAGTHNWTVSPTSTVTRQRLDIGYASGQPWIQVHFSQSCTPGQNPCDIERIILGVDVERIR